MDVHATAVIKLLDGEKQCVIPLFQRRYSWSLRQWKTLWKDLEPHLGRPPGQLPPHFFGAVVALPWQVAPAGVNRHLIIDGQQRLTTISLLLAALRFCLGEPDASKVRDLYLINQYADETHRHKVLPTEADRPAYAAVIDGTDLQPFAKEPVVLAYHFFRKKLTDGDDTLPRQVLAALQHALHSVLITLSQQDDPYLIFESLNHKGQPLTQADLVRNYVLMHTASGDGGEAHQQEVHRTYWAPMEQRIREAVKRARPTGKRGKGKESEKAAKRAAAASDRALTEFFRADAMRCTGDIVSQSRVYEVMRDRLRALPDAASLEDEVARLADSSRHQAKFIDPSGVADEALADRLEALRRLRQTTPHPLLLELFESRKAGRLSPQELHDAVLYIESFILRRQLCGIPTNQLQRLFVTWAQGLRKDRPEQPRQWLLEEMRRGTGNRHWPTDAEFTHAILTQSQYGRSGVQLLLDRIERSRGHKERVDLKNATVEHVMPQKLNAGWRDEIGHKAAADHKLWVHRLGNLTLTAYNPELGNKPFTEKRKLYRDSHIDMTIAIAWAERWGYDAIERRGNELAAKACELWPGPVSTV